MASFHDNGSLIVAWVRVRVVLDAALGNQCREPKGPDAWGVIPIRGNEGRDLLCAFRDWWPRTRSSAVRCEKRKVAAPSAQSGAASQMSESFRVARLRSRRAVRAIGCKA